MVVRAKTTGVIRFKPINGDTQCEVTLVQHGDAGGFVPERIMVAKIPQALSGVEEMREIFQRDDAIDGAKRSELAAIIKYLSKARKHFDQSRAIDAASNLRLVTMIQNHDELFTEKEEAMIKSCMSFFCLFGAVKAKTLKMNSAMTKAKKCFKSGDSHALGWATTTVRASAEQVLAFVWDTEARAKARPDDLEKAVDERPSKHNMLVYNRKKTPKVVEDRDFLGRAVWKKTERGFVVVTRPEESQRRKRGAVPNTVRATYPSAMKITRIGENETKLEGLKEVGEKHEWFKVLLAKVVANKLRPAGDSKAKLCNMSAKEANVIGGALALCIAANLTAPAAVDEWMLRYPAMGELEREYVWFRPMMDTVAQRLLESVSWGLKMRLCTGAGLSTMDLLSDMYMIYTYATTGQQGTALSLAVMVGLCIGVQLLIV
ncbi:hypothetical protein TeGR_g4895, partial [Tetraparma gracilis]